MRVLTGIKPTGTIHLGNLVGAIRPALRLAQQGLDAMYFIADYHALTTVQPPEHGAADMQQLVYEIGDPGRYRSPDVTVSFLGLTVTDLGSDRILVTGARGSPAPDRLKVSATYRDGFRAAGTLTIVGESAPLKARRAAEAVFESLRRRGITFMEQLTECLGTGACGIGGTGSTAGAGQPFDEAIETVLRMAVADPDRRKVEAFTRSLTPPRPPSSLEELVAIAQALVERVDLPPDTRYRLVGVGVGGFADIDDESMVQGQLFASGMLDAGWTGGPGA